MVLYIVINILSDICDKGAGDLCIQRLRSSRSVFIWAILRCAAEVCALSGKTHNLQHLSLVICENHLLHSSCTARPCDSSIDNAIRESVVCEK